MAAHYLDGCDHYNTAILTSGTGPFQITSGSPTVAATSGRFGGPCIDLGTVNLTTTGVFLSRILFTNPQTIIQGCWVKELSGTNQGGDLFTHITPYTNKCWLAVNTLGGFSVTAGNNTNLGISSNGLFPFNQWNWVVWKVFYHGTTGTVDVYVNGTNVYSLSGKNTAQDFSGNGLFANCARFSNDGNFVHRYMDDLFVFDDTGTTCNFVPQPQRIVSSFLSGAGGHTDFAPTGAASNWQAASDVSPDDATSYNLSNTTSARDSFLHSAVSNISAVSGAMIWARAQVDNASAHTLSLTGTSAASDFIGPALTLSSSFNDYVQEFSIDPATAALWATLAAINASEIGYKLVA